VKIPNGAKKAAAQDAASDSEPGNDPEAGQRPENGAGRN
jgi:hypothetical protein